MRWQEKSLWKVLSRNFVTRSTRARRGNSPTSSNFKVRHLAVSRSTLSNRQGSSGTFTDIHGFSKPETIHVSHRPKSWLSSEDASARPGDLHLHLRKCRSPGHSHSQHHPLLQASKTTILRIQKFSNHLIELLQAQCCLRITCSMCTSIAEHELACGTCEHK